MNILAHSNNPFVFADQQIRGEKSFKDKVSQQMLKEALLYLILISRGIFQLLVYVHKSHFVPIIRIQGEKNRDNDSNDPSLKDGQPRVWDLV